MNLCAGDSPVKKLQICFNWKLKIQKMCTGLIRLNCCLNVGKSKWLSSGHMHIWLLLRIHELAISCTGGSCKSYNHEMTSHTYRVTMIHIQSYNLCVHNNICVNHHRYLVCSSFPNGWIIILTPTLNPIKCYKIPFKFPSNLTKSTKIQS